jgi:hypothetical protein
MLMADNRDSFLGVFPRQVSIIIWGLLAAGIISLFWFRIPLHTSYIYFMAGLATAVFLLTQWKPCWALFLTILFIPGITTFSNTLFSAGTEYEVQGWLAPMFSFFKEHLGMFTRDEKMGVFGPASLIPANAFIFGVWLRSWRLKQAPAPNPVRIPILVFIALSILSAIVAFWRYSDFWPLYNNPYFEQLVNTQGMRASQAFEKIIWTLVNYGSGALLMLAVCQVSWESRQADEDTFDVRIWIARWIILPVFIGSLIPIAIGFYQTKNIWFGANKVYVWPWVKRINASFFDPNALGSFIVLYISWALAGIGLLVSVRKRQAFLGCGAGILLVTCIMLVTRFYPDVIKIEFFKKLLPGSFNNLPVLFCCYTAALILMLSIRRWYALFGCAAGIMSLHISMYLLIHSGSRMAILGIVMTVFAAIFFTLAYFLQKVKTGISLRMFRYATAGLLVLYLAAGLWLFYVGAPKFVSQLGKKASINKTSLYKRIRKMPWGSAQGFYKQIMDDRGPYAAIATKMIQDAPLTGVGLGCFVVELNNWKKVSDVTIYVPDTACNYYLQVAAEQGIIALAAILLFFILWWRHWWQVWQQEWARMYWLMIGAGMVSMMTIFIFGMHTLAHEIQCLFWLFLSQPLIVIIHRRPPVQPPRYRWLLVVAIIGVYFSFAITRLSLEQQRERFGWYKHAGFYGWERWESSAPRMRYTDARAETFLKAKGLSFVQPWVCFHPDITVTPVNVTITFDSFVTNVSVSDQEWRTFVTPIPYDKLNHSIPFTIEADRTWSPKEFDITNDSRRLGVTLQDYKWKRSDDMYGSAQWRTDDSIMSGKPYRWSGKHGRFLRKVTAPYVSFPLLVSHPDVTQRPVNITVYFNDTAITNFSRDEGKWKNIVLFREHPQFTNLYNNDLCIGVEVDRTWCPMDYDIEDTRELGAAVGGVDNIYDWGFYDRERWPTGFDYRWAGEEAIWAEYTGEDGAITVDYLIDHKNVVEEPVTWSLYTNGVLAVKATIPVQGWHSATIEAEPGTLIDMRATVDRTYIPARQGGIDERELGFGIKMN